MKYTNTNKDCSRLESRLFKCLNRKGDEGICRLSHLNLLFIILLDISMMLPIFYTFEAGDITILGGLKAAYNGLNTIWSGTRLATNMDLMQSVVHGSASTELTEQESINVMMIRDSLRNFPQEVEYIICVTITLAILYCCTINICLFCAHFGPCCRTPYTTSYNSNEFKDYNAMRIFGRTPAAVYPEVFAGYVEYMRTCYLMISIVAILGQINANVLIFNLPQNIGRYGLYLHWFSFMGITFCSAIINWATNLGGNMFTDKDDSE